MGFLTPSEAPDTVTCRALFVPNGEEYLAIVRGLLQELTFVTSWDKFGTLSREEAAAAFVDMFDRFCLEKDTCRMIGEIIPYAGVFSPKDNWLVCDGSEVSQGDYPDLFTLIGDTYGSASAGNFRLPDLRARSPIGSSESYAVGTQVGEAEHTLTVAEMPVHNHTDTGHQHSIPSTITFTALTGEEPVNIPVPIIPSYTGLASANISNTGSGDAHNNIPPSLAITYLIVAKEG